MIMPSDARLVSPTMDVPGELYALRSVFTEG